VTSNLRYRDIGDVRVELLPGIAMSTDGRTLAFSAGSAYSEAGINDHYAFFRGGLYIRRLGEADAVPVAGADDAWQPAFSPDGSRIAYVRRDNRFSGQIETIAVTGGRPTPLTTRQHGDRGDRLDRRGSHHLRNRRTGCGASPRAAARSRTSPACLTTAPRFARLSPTPSPGGRGILYTVV
jgi:dipeptidyl aminopeptidase/acylaminoacyl peptidase